MQRADAVVFDPYPLDDVGPPIVGGRPLGYQRPVPEVTRGRMYRDSLGLTPRSTAPIFPQGVPGPLIPTGPPVPRGSAQPVYASPGGYPAAGAYPGAGSLPASAPAGMPGSVVVGPPVQAVPPYPTVPPRPDVPPSRRW
jgi:hypothetical protein